MPEFFVDVYKRQIQEFMDDFLGLYISPRNRLMNSLLSARTFIYASILTSGTWKPASFSMACTCLLYTSTNQRIDLLLAE